MKVAERSSPDTRVTRRFRKDVRTMLDLEPGAIVCLSFSSGEFLMANHSPRTNFWEICKRHWQAASNSLPVEALFVVLRRGNQLGFQCVGAEGRMLHGDLEGTETRLRLIFGFNGTSAWEPVSAQDTQLVNVDRPQVLLGAIPRLVTAMPAYVTSAWEDAAESRFQEVLTKLKARIEAEAASEQRSRELIKAGQRAAAESREEIEELRSKLEAANKNVLLWQEEAALACRQPDEQPSAGNQHPRVADLQRRLAEMQVRYGQDIAKVREEHALALRAAREALEIEHAAHVERLLEERTRLDSALRCIKDMTRQTWGVTGDCDGARTLASDQELAVGIPVENASLAQADSPPLLPTAQAGAGSSSANHSGSSFTLAPRPTSSATTASYVSAAAAESTFTDERCRRESPPPLEYGIRSFPRAALFSASDMGEPTDTSTTAMHNVYRFASGARPDHHPADAPGGYAPEEQVCSEGMHAGGSMPRCVVVDHRGHHPELLTEMTMDRILDRPLPSLEEIEILTGQNDAYLLTSSVQIKRDHDSTPTGSPVMTSYRLVDKRRGVPSVSAPTSAAKLTDNCDDPIADWPAGTLSLPGSRSATPLPEDDDVLEARVDFRLSAAVNALNADSPTDANLMAQYMADQVAARASLPLLWGGKHRCTETDVDNCGKATIPAIRKSAPARTLQKRASFLTRPPVAETELYLR